MASNVTFDSSFPDDTEEENRVTKTLEDLVNGSIEPSYAAEIIDKINIDSYQADYVSYISLPSTISEQILMTQSALLSQLDGRNTSGVA